MKAVFWQGGKNFQLGDAPVPKPGPNQVLLKVEAASICTSDFHYADWNCTPPIIPGHEAAGTVVELGKNVSNIKIGLKAALDPVQRCGKCPMCTEGIGHLCLKTRHLGNSENPGAWAEYVVVDAANIHPVPQNVSAAEACLTEPVAVCMESFNRANFKPDTNILILGDGTFGFIHAIFARIYGAKNIIVAGHYDQRLKRIAEKTGAIICNTHNQDIKNVLQKVCGSVGVHLVIEATGATASPNIGVNALRPRGTLVLFSCVWKPEILDINTVGFQELNVLGSCRSLNCFDDCLRLMSQKEIDVKAFTDIQLPLAEYNKAISGLFENKANVFKAILIP
jgi:L-iditol 2-dehydrogenase